MKGNKLATKSSCLIYVAVVKKTKTPKKKKKKQIGVKIRILRVFEKVVVLLLNMFNFMTLMINAGEVNIDQTYFQLSSQFCMTVLPLTAFLLTNNQFCTNITTDTIEFSLCNLFSHILLADYSVYLLITFLDVFVSILLFDLLECKVIVICFGNLVMY